jgi:hypothetical protein
MQYLYIMENYKFANFEMAYYPYPLDDVGVVWKKMGGQMFQLIEPFDGTSI